MDHVSETNDIKEGKEQPKAIPKLCASRKDTKKRHGEIKAKKPMKTGSVQFDTVQEASEVAWQRSTSKGTHRTRKPGLASSTRGPESPALGQVTPTDLKATQRVRKLGRSLSMDHIERPVGSHLARPMSPKQSHERHKGQRSRSPKEKSDRRPRAAPENAHRSRTPSPSRVRLSPSGSPLVVGKKKGLPPKSASTDSRIHPGSSRAGPTRGATRLTASSSRGHSPNGIEWQRTKSNQNLVQRRPIEALREKSARNLIRKAKTFDDSGQNLSMSWRRARRDMTASRSHNALNSESSKFLDTDLKLEGDDDADDKDSDQENGKGSIESKTSDISPNSSGVRASRNGQNSPRIRKKKAHGSDISRNQLARGLELQDQRVREEEEEEERRRQEEEEERRRRLQLKRSTSSHKSGGRSRSPNRQRDQGAGSRPLVTLTAPKIVLPTVASASQSATAAAAAAYQRANAASHATYQAATVMSEAAARAAAAALTLNSTIIAPNSSGMEPAPRSQKSTISELELASRFHFNKKAGSVPRGLGKLPHS